jgi:xanthine dehydrogenase D subunit
MSTGTTSVSATGARIGVSALRPDGIPKVKGEFEFSSDLHAEGMLWAHILRSPYPSARIRSIDLSAAWKIAGVQAIVTQEDVPGTKYYGLEHQDQPVFAHDVVRFYGEPLAAIAADHPETARRAAEAIVVDYEVLSPLIDAEAAITAAPIHPEGNVFRHLVIRHGDQSVTGDVIVEGTYEVGMQDQAFLGPESGLAIPEEGGGGVDLHVSTQWLHSDLWQLAPCLGLPEAKVRVHLAGVGGAFGAREDVSMHVHLCMLALRTGRPVKIVYSRLESFLGHVHRHPARMWYRHHATKDGMLQRIECRLVFDGGAYMSSSRAVIANAACFATGPYNVPSATVDGWAVRTNNPSCGAMRGFGAVQTCYGHESQMDLLAEACGLSAVEIRQRNLIRTGDVCITGQVLDGNAPTDELLEWLTAAPLPVDTRASDPMMARPGGAGRTADADHVRRGVGLALGWKNLAFSEGFDDYSTASCTIANGQVSIKSACAEVGQGFVTIAQQIARTVLGVEDVVLEPADTLIGSAGSTSASRQTWMSGGAVMAACEAVRDQVIAVAAALWGVSPEGVQVRDGAVSTLNGEHQVALVDLAPGERIHQELEYRHRPTFTLNEDGQGDAHVSWGFAAHRAVVDVDAELGLVRVIEMATTQDTGTILNPLHVVGQIEGGTAQGVGLAVMEEIVLDNGKVRNPSFTDYLIPTALDMPTVNIAGLYDEPEPGAPFGAKGVGEPPTISSTPAIAAAIRNATGLALPRVPIRPQDIALA